MKRLVLLLAICSSLQLSGGTIRSRLFIILPERQDYNIMLLSNQYGLRYKEISTSVSYSLNENRNVIVLYKASTIKIVERGGHEKIEHKTYDEFTFPLRSDEIFINGKRKSLDEAKKILSSRQKEIKSDTKDIFSDNKRNENSPQKTIRHIINIEILSSNELLVNFQKPSAIKMRRLKPIFEQMRPNMTIGDIKDVKTSTMKIEVTKDQLIHKILENLDGASPESVFVVLQHSTDTVKSNEAQIIDEILMARGFQTLQMGIGAKVESDHPFH